MKYIYGAAFDPLTTAHVSIIEELVRRLGQNDELIILVTNNDEKQYAEPIKHRLDVVSDWASNCKGVGDKYLMSVHIKEQNTRMYEFLCGNGYAESTEKVTLVVGTDEWHNLIDGKWEHSADLLSNYRFLIVSRDDTPVRLTNKYALPTLNILRINMETNVSSTAVRVGMKYDPMYCVDGKHNGLINPYVANYIAKKGYYNQNPPSYESDQAKFIDNYRNVEAPKHNYPDPSNTVDIVFVYSRQVLLIRRKNYPYKNFWCLPGGFFDKTDQDLEHTAARELKEETGIDLVPEGLFKQIKTYSHIFDPRLRIIDTAFLVDVPWEMAPGGFHVCGMDDAADAAWFDLDDLPRLGFHHRQIIEDALNMAKKLT